MMMRGSKQGLRLDWVSLIVVLVTKVVSHAH